MYVELHALSAFSFLRGASAPEDLVARAAEAGLGGLCLVDHDGLYGAPRFFQAARAAGVRPLVGASVAVADDAPGAYGAYGALRGRLALLVEGREGYRNLCALLTLAKLRVTREALREGAATVTLAELAAHKQGLVALLTAADEPLRAVAASSRGGGQRAGEAWARALVAVFGKASLAVEVTRHLHRAEERRTQRLLALASALGVPAVATNDARYARPDDAPLHDVMACIREHVTLDDAGRRLGRNREWHLKATAEMTALFRDLPRALVESRRLAERCAFTLADLGYAFPEFPLPRGEASEMSYLRTLVAAGARDRYGDPSARVAAQLARELALIEKLGLAGYFLIVWDLARYCREQGILAQGRGSAANSAVCYALGITAVDPVGMELLFERFLSEERGEWPDIDLDLPSGDRRERVIQYVYSRYGPRGAAMTANVITYRARSAVREVGKVLGLPNELLDRTAKHLSHVNAADRDELARRLGDAGLDARDGRVALLLALAGRIQHLPRHLGQHPGGMVIARGRLDHVVPLEPAAMPGRVVIEWDKDDCADLGILKIDLLGLGMMALLQDVVGLVRDHDGVALDLARLPPDDPATYAMLQRADTVGVFQVESRAQMATLPRLRPETFYDLVVEVAIIRPGPIVGKLVHPYINRRLGREPVTYPHPMLEGVLKRTLGVPLFQEQLMRVAMIAAGFTGAQAEQLRRALGSKRSADKMVDVAAKLRDGMTRNGLSAEAQAEVVRGIVSFSQYGFPESHSASFALLVYASAYIKQHHPASFYTAILNQWPMGFYHPATLVKDAQRHGVRVLPVDVTRSSWRCTREGPALRLGLCYVRGLREAVGRAIEAARPFASLDDLRRRARPSAAELAALAELGALAAVDAAHPWTRREALWQVQAIAAQPDGLLARADLPREPSPLADMTLAERIAADYRATGLTVGPHPVALLRDALDREGVLSAAALARAPHGRRARVAGAVITRQRPETAKGFFFVTLEDETGLANGIVAPPVYERHRATLVAAAGLVLEGLVQRQDGVVSLKVARAEPLPGMDAPVRSHDFH